MLIFVKEVYTQTTIVPGDRFKKKINHAGVHKNHIAKGKLQPFPVRQGAEEIVEMAQRR